MGSVVGVGVASSGETAVIVHRPAPLEFFLYKIRHIGIHTSDHGGGAAVSVQIQIGEAVFPRGRDGVSTPLETMMPICARGRFRTSHQSTTFHAPPKL